MLYKVVLLLSLWMKSLSMTIQMKATEQYFPVVLSVYYAVQGVSSFETVDGILKCGHSNESYCAERPVLVKHNVVLTVKSVDKILQCDHSNASYLTKDSILLCVCTLIT